MKKKYRSSSLNRSVRTYYPGPVKKMIIAYAKDEGISQSKACVYAVKKFFNDMPQHLKDRYRQIGRSDQDRNSG